MADRKLIVEVIGDDRSFQQAMNRSTAATTQFQSRFTRLNQSLRGGIAGSGVGARGSLLFGSGAFVGTAAITAALSKSIQAASDLNEQITKSQAVFGDSSKAVLDWSHTTAQAIGVSQTAALEATGTFGNLFKTVGLAPQSAAEMSQSLVRLAADMASFNNASIEDVLLAIRSGLVGEAEPLRRYGVLLSETRVQQVALAETGKRNVRSLTDQEKALARYHIILQDTTAAQGDFAKTSQGLANQSRILNANISDLSASIGSVLLPVVITAVQDVNGLVDAFDRLGKVKITPGGEGGGGGTLDGLKNKLQSIFGDRQSKDLVLNILFPGLGFNINNLELLSSLLRRVNQQAPPGGIVGPPGGGGAGGLPAAIASLKAKQDAESARRAAKAFSEHVKGLDLKLDKAGLTKGLDDDIAALRELEASILRRIQVEGRTFKLVQQLTSTRKQINNLLEQRAGDRAAASAKAFSDTLDALDLRLDIAKATRQFGDDLAALREIESQIRARIRAEGRTTDLARQLFENRQAQNETVRQQLQAQQFEAIGLNRDGSVPAPSGQSELSRAKSLQQRIKGTPLDTEANRTQLAKIVAFLKANYKKAGRDVRLAIDEMLDEIAGGFEKKKKGSSSTGPLTKTTSLNTHKILQGLGLSDEEARALQNRLSNFNSAGVGFAGSNRGSGNFVTDRDRGFVIENNVTVEIDGQKITATVTKQQQRARRRNPLQKRGPNRAGTGGH